MRALPFLHGVRRDEAGASIIEFALFAPLLAFMLMGITDFSMGYAQKLRMEQATYRALEKVAVGSVQSDYQYLRAEAAAADGTGGIQASHVTVDNWLECNRARQPDFNGDCAAGVDRSRYVRVTINYSYTPRFAAPLIVDSSGVVPLTASAALRIQ